MLDARRHTADEEQSLFPLLRASGSDEAEAVLETVEALEHDHATADRAHTQVDTLYRRWIELGTVSTEDRSILNRELHGLREMYRRHIEVEDRHIFPLAGKILTSDQLVHVGEEMAKRRGMPARARS